MFDVLALGRPERATDGAIATIELGLQFANDLADTTFASGHLLSGLFREPKGVAHGALENLGLSQRQIDDAVSNSMRHNNPQTVIDDDIGIVLTAAFEAVDEMSDVFMGTEHLLIGATAQRTRSSAILIDLGLTRSVVVKEVHDILGHGLEEEAS